MTVRENVRYFDVIEYRTIQLIPSDGYVVVYAKQDGGTFTSPVVAWGLVDERVQSRVCWKVDGQHHAENDGEAVVNRKVVPFSLYHQDGELKPPNGASNFIGVCPTSDDAAVFFADELKDSET